MGNVFSRKKELSQRVPTMKSKRFNSRHISLNEVTESQSRNVVETDTGLRKINQYKFNSVIGRGSFGEVWLAVAVGEGGVDEALVEAHREARAEERRRGGRKSYPAEGGRRWGPLGGGSSNFNRCYISLIKRQALFRPYYHYAPDWVVYITHAG